MSYDLIVASEEEADLPATLGQLRAVAGVQAVNHTDDQLEVILGLPHGDEATFFIGSSVRAERDDIDALFFEYVRHPQWLTEITVPAHAGELGIEVVRRVAILIARAAKGAAFDPQEDGIFWPTRRLLFRRAPASASAKRDLDIVSLNWIVALPKEHAIRAHKSAKLCVTYIDSIAENLPTATPVRCGSFEPFQGKGIADFETEWRLACESELGQTFHFTAKPPYFGGHVDFSYPRHSLESPKHSLCCLHISLNVDASSISTKESEDALTRNFAKVADRLNAIYGAAHLLRGWEYFRGQLWARRGTESSPQLTRNGWIGLPPTPAWMAWLNRAYLDQMSYWRSAGTAITAKNGQAFKFGAHPCPIETAMQSMPPLPEELSFRPGQETVTGHNPGAQPASRILAYEAFALEK